MKRPAQQGIALVITLIMLSVITFLAITFLAVSRREQGSVTTATDETTARLAADAALENAKVGLLAPMLAATNGQLFDLLVSTNYINPYGYNQLLGNVVNFTNVNYNYRADGTIYTADDLQRNIANLLFNPRPPVFVATNRDRSLPLDFRFYLDLNRNGRFDTNGVQPMISDDPINRWFDTNGNPEATFNPDNVLRTNFVGDPEWVGILDKPGLAHSPSNRFVARYAFIAIPAGRTLDINYIHNQAKRLPPDAQGFPDGFRRNQGVGTWEINLASFLADLNTNIWLPQVPNTYIYDTNIGPTEFSSQGIAFQDALSILTNRYGGSYNNLFTARQVFSNNATSFIQDNVDEYSDGPYLWNTTNIDESFIVDQDKPNLPWPGADAPNHFFTLADLFDRTRFPQNIANFADRLVRAGTNDSSYSRYTYYRLLSQLGTDTGPEKDKLNVNYVNLDKNDRIVPNLATNLVRWSTNDNDSLRFFKLAADRLLRNYTTNWLAENPTNYLLTFNLTNALYNGGSPAKGTNLMDMTNTFGITNIPVWINNKFVYTPSVHRLLQLAANIYDATSTNGMENGIGYPALPSAFRPVFKSVTNAPDFNIDVYIAGFTNVIDANDIVLAGMRDLYDTNDLHSIEPTNLVHGVPIIIGAKKGLPNFNEYAYMNTVGVSRRLEFQHLNTNSPPDPTSNPVAYTNQFYTVEITNSFAVESWNSYRTNYPRALRVIVTNDFSFLLYTTNSLNQQVILVSNRFAPGWATNYTPGTWKAFPGALDAPLADQAVAFQLPLTNNLNLSFSSNSFVYVQSPTGFGDKYTRTVGIDANLFPINRWYMRLSNRLRYIMVDTQTDPTHPRLVDYVSLNINQPELDVTRTLMSGLQNPPQDPTHELEPTDGAQWITNAQPASGSPGLPVGILNQILAGTGDIPAASLHWRSVVGDAANATANFRANLSSAIGTNQGSTLVTIFNAPYVPYRVIYDYRSLQANDPLVHYTLQDLTDLSSTNTITTTPPNNPPLKNIGSVNKRCQPWGIPGNWGTPGDFSGRSEFKDPLVRQSDDWDFPTNVLPNIGWLGRVHRGTPWQTIYLKSTDIITNANNNLPIDWQQWTGNADWSDSLRSKPTEDWKLFDFFTTALDENATRGQLSVNQSGLAAWSAVLSGVLTLTNSDTDIDPTGLVPPVTMPWPIEPSYGSPETPLSKIVAGINRTRAANTNFNSAFQHAGDVLATPELTFNSPYLNTNIVDQLRYGISEEMYERIPQQIMSLLRLGEQRFVIYSYGQTLRPATRSLVTSGPLFGLCTNYQVTAEVATRTVLRINNAPKPGDTNTLPRIEVESFNILPPE